MRVLLLIIFMNIYALQTLASQRPAWEDHCPVGLCDAIYTDIKWYWPDTTRATQEIYNYWAKRRQEFEESIAKCDMLQDEFQSYCYENIKAKQIIDNEVFKTTEENKKIRNQVWKDTNKVTNWVMFNIIPE